MTDCSQLDLGFHPQLPVHLAFDAAQTSSDGGALLLRQIDERLKLCERFAFCVPDFRDPRLVSKELSADTGYCSEENLKGLNRHQIRGYIATGRIDGRSAWREAFGVG